MTSSCLFRLFRITCYVSLDLPFHLQIICPSLFSGHFVSCYIFYEKMPCPYFDFFIKFLITLPKQLKLEILVTVFLKY